MKIILLELATQDKMILLFFWLPLSIFLLVRYYNKKEKERRENEERKANELKRELEKKEAKKNAQETQIQNEHRIILHNADALQKFSNKFKITDISQFNNKIISNQASISNEFMFSFIKLNDYLKTKQKTIKEQYELLINSEIKNKEIDSLIDRLDSQNIFLSKLSQISESMILALCNKDMFTFYTIYNQFEKLGIFEKEWEKRLINSMKNIDKKLADVIYSIDTLDHSISNSITELQLEIENLRGEIED